MSTSQHQPYFEKENKVMHYCLSQYADCLTDRFDILKV